MIDDRDPWDGDEDGLGAFRAVVLLLSCALALAALVFLPGCGSQRAEKREEQRTREESFRVELAIPLPGPDGWRLVPLPITGTRTTTETRSGEVRVQTTINAPELAAALGGALRQAFPAIGAIMGPPPSGPAVPPEAMWGGAGTALTGAAWLLAKLRRDKSDAEWEAEVAEKVKLADSRGYERGRADALAERRAGGA
jgi:hypothetical protein